MPITINQKIFTDLFQRVGEQLNQIFLSTVGTQVALTVQNGVVKKNVQEEIEDIRKEVAAIGQAAAGVDFYKGKVNSDAEIPTTYKPGWVWKVGTAGTYKGNACEVGDMIMANTAREGSGNVDSDFDVYQANIDGAVIGPVTAVPDNLAAFDGGVGRSIKDSGIAMSGVSDAVTKKHEHANQTDVLDKLGTSAGKLTYDGQPVGGDSLRDIMSVDNLESMPAELREGGFLVAPVSES